MTAKYTPDELRAQINKMWLRNYPVGPTDQNWILNVGIGTGMLSVAADRISELEAELADWQRMRNEAMAVAISNRTRINTLEAALRKLGYAAVEYMVKRGDDQAFVDLAQAEHEARALLPSQLKSPAAADPNNGLPEPTSIPPMPAVPAPRGNMSGTARINIAKVFGKMAAAENSDSEPKKN